MKIACFIPIKSYSERVSGKNFRPLNGHKLYEYIIQNTIKANCFDTIYVDTNSDEVKEYCLKHGVNVIDRKPELASNIANGNDLLVHHYNLFPDYDYYFQLFATAPYLSPESIRACCEKLVSSQKYDSCFTATKNNSFYWFNDLPINYRPNILPRSQDMTPVFEESTGLYGISHKALSQFLSRIGRTPYIHIVDKLEALDINTEEDLLIAEAVFNLFPDKFSHLK